MVTVFLSHSSKDKPFVRELADYLERASDVKAWLDEREIAPGQNIVGRIQDGLSADLTVLILSPHSIGSNWVKEEWMAAFWQQTNQRETKLIPVLYGDCEVPALLANKSYIDARTDQLEAFRKLHTFLLTKKPVAPERVNYLPSRPPLFVGREPELAELRRRLNERGAVVHIAELAGKGKTMLALEFAHRYQQDFEAVYWLPCQSGSLASIAAELERQLGLKVEGDLQKMVRDLKDICAGKRCLLILDNVEVESPGELVPGGVASVLVTTRNRNLKFLRSREPLALPLFSDEQCFVLFRRQIGEQAVAKAEADCRKLFQRLGNLPIGVSVCAALIREDVRYTIASLAKELPADAKDAIQKAIDALDSVARGLLSAMAACAPEGFGLSLAAEVAELDEKAALDALQHLVSRSLAEEVDRDERRYRLRALVRDTADGRPFAAKHAWAMRKRFQGWETDWRECSRDWADFQVALDWALAETGGAAKEFPVQDFAYCGYSLTRRIGRPADALEICERLGGFSERAKDEQARQAWLGNQALILIAWGRLEEALALHKKKEEICQKLGNQDSLQRSYWNQALILIAWGRLEEALALHKKKEEICLQLGDQDSLQASYGNQALILRAWGRLEEALALHKKQEEICLQLGNRDDLGTSYHNQADILRETGKLDEAVALYKKEEAIYQSLGSKEGLGYCYWSVGLLEGKRGNRQAAREKLTAALALFTELQMPRERDAVQVALENAKAAGAG